MSNKKALIFYGGWEGHSPLESSKLITSRLVDRGIDVQADDHLSTLSDAELLKSFDLIIPMWTMGKLEDGQEKNLCEAVRSGVGLGGFHGGMGDAFRGCIDYEWMVGGHFLGHPHVGNYAVKVSAPSNPLVSDMPAQFNYDSEQYYMCIDPSINVLATTEYKNDGSVITMPVIWTKRWGKGKIYYNALGHELKEFDAHPYVLDSIIKGLLWAGNLI